MEFTSITLQEAQEAYRILNEESLQLYLMRAVGIITESEYRDIEFRFKQVQSDISLASEDGQDWIQ